MRKAKWNHRFYKNYRFRWLPEFRYLFLRWKDKFETPRCEQCPQWTFEWLWWGFIGISEDDHYWEQHLWIHKYNNGDELKAKETWGWIDCDTNKSSWKNYQ